jgi:hypothetical protein
MGAIEQAHDVRGMQVDGYAIDIVDNVAPASGQHSGAGT